MKFLISDNIAADHISKLKQIICLLEKLEMFKMVRKWTAQLAESTTGECCNTNIGKPTEIFSKCCLGLEGANTPSNVGTQHFITIFLMCWPYYNNQDGKQDTQSIGFYMGEMLKFYGFEEQTCMKSLSTEISAIKQQLTQVLNIFDANYKCSGSCKN